MKAWDAPFGPLWYATGVMLAGLATMMWVRARKDPTTSDGLLLAATWRVMVVLLALGAFTRLLSLWR